DNDIWTVLYMDNTATVPLKAGTVKLTQRTDYPWDDHISIKIEPEKETNFTLHLRVPGWSHLGLFLSLNGEPVRLVSPDEKGMYRITRTWKSGDRVVLAFDMNIARVYADPRVKADVGRVALQRGPMVYCLEGVDNHGHVRSLSLPRNNKLEA